VHLHTHFSFLGAAQSFLGVVIIGTLWRVGAMHLVASNNETAQHIGKSMLLQY
jgi:hypothetical protein